VAAAALAPVLVGSAEEVDPETVEVGVVGLETAGVVDLETVLEEAVPGTVGVDQQTVGEEGAGLGIAEAGQQTVEGAAPETVEEADPETVEGADPETVGAVLQTVEEVAAGTVVVPGTVVG